MSGETVQTVDVGRLAPERFKEALDPEPYERFAEGVAQARSLLEGRVVYNINSTAHGGGVAEMLRSLLAYAGGAGVDARWLVIPGHPDFFRVTKRLHNHLHGAEGDGGDLGPEEARVYERYSRAVADELSGFVTDKDIVIVHDPQPAALVPPLVEMGATVVWRCHIGVDTPNDRARHAWEFLLPYVRPAHAYVFSRLAFAWDGLDRSQIEVIPPSIDAFSPKNQELDRRTVRAILAASGVVSGNGDGAPRFTRANGDTAEVTSRATMIEDAPAPADARIVTQVSRWDRLKDPMGVITGFAEHAARACDAHLIVAGPDVAAVADDPEGAEVLEACKELRQKLPDDVRSRIHLAALPMSDGEENAAIVNALQRVSDVVVQKSLAEGFGLTVAEAMWKARPVVASRIGGIQDQISDGETGILLADPSDLAEYGERLVEILGDEERAGSLGDAAQRRVRDSFLGTRHLLQYLDLFRKLIG